MQELLSFLPANRSLSSGEHWFYFTTEDGNLFRQGDDEPLTQVNLPWPIRMVSTDCNTTAVITYSGEVYTWTGSMDDVRLLKLPLATVSVGIGTDTIMAVTIDGHLYIEDSGSPATLIDLPFICREVVCQSTNTRLVTPDGSLYTLKFTTNTATKVLLEEPVSMVVMGSSHTLILSITGKVLSCGSNINGQVGIGDKGGVVSVPVHLPLPAKCRLIACGHSHSLAVLETGEIYGWGDTSEGELGVYDTELYRPTLVDAKDDIIMVGGGLMHTVMIDKDDQVYINGQF